MQPLSDYSLQELKQIYRILQNSIMDTPELFNSQLLADLQAYLQQQAMQDGVDISTHGEWSAWLNGLFVPTRQA